MSGKLIVAVPAKGRLQENAEAFFARAGLKLKRDSGARGYTGRFAGIDDIDVLFLSASEIAGELAAGNVHLGVTGEDLIREKITDADRIVDLSVPLGFGFANVVVAVPQVWIDVDTMADLDDVAESFRARHGRPVRIATKYVNLTRGFFARFGIVDYRIVESLGATEGAPSSGAADAIVDITTTGATLAANALKVLADGTMLESQAHLVTSLKADWNQATKSALRNVFDRIAAELNARSVREIRARVDGAAASAIARRHDCALPFGEDASPAVLHCPADSVHAVTVALREAGATAVSVSQPEDVFAASNPLYDGIVGRLVAR
ncbi:MAG: ATP phosphoribosyltransferase [Rhodobiaceae bacterium]|nr:ATP phosphoribosyltransferase [Rhodobiaceae bacterium]MCC0054894.1 ATP phosphoribosyltransferase [Rhodobiaceae bacterium]